MQWTSKILEEKIKELEIFFETKNKSNFSGKSAEFRMIKFFLEELKVPVYEKEKNIKEENYVEYQHYFNSGQIIDFVMRFKNHSIGLEMKNLGVHGTADSKPLVVLSELFLGKYKMFDSFIVGLTGKEWVKTYRLEDSYKMLKKLKESKLIQPSRVEIALNEEEIKKEIFKLKGLKINDLSKRFIITLKENWNVCETKNKIENLFNDIKVVDCLEQLGIVVCEGSENTKYKLSQIEEIKTIREEIC